MKPLLAHFSFNTSGQSFRYYNVVWWCFQLLWDSLTLFIPLQSVSSVYYSVLQSMILLKHNRKWHNRRHFIIYSYDPPTRSIILPTHFMKKIFFLFFFCGEGGEGGGGGGAYWIVVLTIWDWPSWYTILITAQFFCLFYHLLACANTSIMMDATLHIRTVCLSVILTPCVFYNHYVTQ